MRGRRQGRRLFLEGLEDRRLLAQVTSLELNPHEYDPSSILVRFRSEAAEARGAGLLHGAALGRDLAAFPGLRSVHLPQGHNVEAALAAYRASPDVLYAEPNYRVQAALTPNDELYPSLYGMENIDAPAAWDVTTGSADIVVGIIDTGVDYNHPDLAPNMWANVAERDGLAGNDDDGNGFVDDVYGYDFYNNDGDPIDDNFHGTHVAGTIGAVGNNGVGVAGVNWNVKIMALKFLDSGGGGWTEDAVEAVNYATMMRSKGVDIRLTSNSWGGGGYSQALVDAINAGGDAGMLFIAAAGNSGSDADIYPMYPAAYDSDYIVSVAATDQFDQYAYFSNWGATSVDLAAPGVDILSTWPGGGYDYLSGTSMATPHVSGAAALVWAEYPDATPLQVKQRLMGGAEYIGGIGGNAFMPTQTNGRLNLVNALEDDSIPPDPITGLAAVESTINSIAVTWVASGDDGAAGMASAYDVRYSTEPITVFNWESATRAVGEPLPQAPGLAESFTVVGLTPDETYYFAVQALDNVGNSSALSDVIAASTLPVIVAFADDMEGGAPGWLPDGLWHLATWRSTSGATSFYYGDDSTMTYDTGWWNSGTLTSPAIDLSGAESALLSFNEFRQVENFAPYDRAAVNVSTDGVYFTPIWESYNSTFDWENRTVDLTPWVGNNVWIQFQFDTGDELYNYFEGWYVDDVQVWVPGSQEPGLYIDNVSVAEGNAGLVEATFTVSLIDTVGPVDVHWETVDGSATDASDYVTGFGDLSFGPGETSQTFTVYIAGDRIDEANEHFFVNLSDAVGAPIIDGQGRATITDDDTAGITLTPDSDLITSESGTNRTLNVVLTSEPTDDVTINFASSDTTEGTVSPASWVFTPANWNVAKSFTITGVNDTLDDGDISYFVSATAASADSAYSGLTQSLAATNKDNDHSVTYTSTAVPKSIPDGGSTTSTLTAGNFTILDVNARVSITHGKDEDVDVYLTAPGGPQVELFTDVGGSGNNFANTTLDDEAGMPITAGSAPFNGTYRPEGSLSAFDGNPSGGTWTLSVADDKKGQKGTLTQWSITIFYEETAAGGTAALRRPSGQVSSGGRSQAAFVPLDGALVDPVFAESAPRPADQIGSRSRKGDPQHDSKGGRADGTSNSAQPSGAAALPAGIGSGSAGGQVASATAVDAALDSLLSGGARKRRR
jgi:subtilisin family serine protease/subtilisin-like proprotein convertase family protein